MNIDIKLLVADDHPMLLKGLVDELTTHGFNVLPGARNGAQALDMISQELPDIAILDINMPLLSGFEVIKKCKEKQLRTKFIVLTSYKEKAYILKAHALNISGYLLKDEPFHEIKKCIQTVYNGASYFSSVFNNVLNEQVAPQLAKIKYLSPSELTIVRMILQGKNSKAISEQLSISIRTVQKHRSNIIAKLDLSSDSDALATWVLENKALLNIL